MSRKDIAAKEFVNDNHVFADLFNHCLFHEEIIDPKNLKEKDTAGIVNDKNVVMQRQRDILKVYADKTDGVCRYVLLGVENQDQVHPAMPLRAMEYDMTAYMNQARQYARQVRRKKGRSGKEILSAWPEGEKLIPVITLVMYWQPAMWEGPKSLHEMMDSKIVRRYGRYIENYGIHVVSPKMLADEEISRMRSELGAVMSVMKYADDRKKMNELMQESRYSEMSIPAGYFIAGITGVKMEEKEEGRMTVNLCKAWADMREVARSEGKAEGMTQGITQGVSETEALMTEVMRRKGFSEETILELKEEMQAERNQQ